MLTLPVPDDDLEVDVEGDEFTDFDVALTLYLNEWMNDPDDHRPEGQAIRDWMRDPANREVVEPVHTDITDQWSMDPVSLPVVQERRLYLVDAPCTSPTVSDGDCYGVARSADLDTSPVPLRCRPTDALRAHLATGGPSLAELGG